jgi:exonuclease III
LWIDGHEFLVASVHPHYLEVGPATECDPRLSGYCLDGARFLWHCDVAFGILSEAVRDRRFIIGGDWNTARAFKDSSVADARFSEAFFERAHSRRWREVGLDTSGRERPTFRDGKYQLDHLFVDEKTFDAKTDAWVATDALDDGLSDHAPIVADFDLGS